MNETLDYLRTFATFPFSLRRFLRHPLTVDEARRGVRERMARREDNFLALVERSVYGWPRSPYLALLRRAGCEFGDLRALVGSQGLEATLRQLRREGVYVTFEEFKGRTPIVRPGLTLAAQPQDFDNPLARREFAMRTGGSSGRAASVDQNLDHISLAAAHQLLVLAAHDLLDAPAALWLPILPGNGFYFLLQRLHSRQRTERWFSPIGWRALRHWLKYDLASLYMLFWLRVWRSDTPLPRAVPQDQALEVARWMHTAVRRHGRCLIHATVSNAVRVCVAARQAGLDLTGATIRAGAEPVTRAKVRAMEQAGARCVPGYGTVEAGGLGLGCARPVDDGEVHLVADAFALITHPHRVEGPGVTVPAFNWTTLCDATPKIMLNFQSDDFGIVEERACGCELEACGYTTHLREIRSYSKLTGEGATLIGNELERILEELLPERFGGSPLDYQLIEEEDERGFTRLSLLISPHLALPEEDAVIAVLLNALGHSSPMADAARAFWQQANTIRIKRQTPVSTGPGKLLPLHVARRAPDS